MGREMEMRNMRESGARPCADEERLGPTKCGTIHDLGNHIQIALSAMRILDGYPCLEHASGARLMLSQATTSLERAGALVHRTLGKSHENRAGPERLRVASCLRQIEPLIAFVCGADVVLDMKIEADLPTIKCSRTDLENAVLNLAFNALDAMPDGGMLSISARGVRAGYSIVAVEIRVADTGSGMNEDVLARAFDFRFTTKEGQGNGLGLFMVKRFVESAHGNVAIQSKAVSGTIVTLCLPATADD
jgi:signal transduction histidine kinase